MFVVDFHTAFGRRLDPDPRYAPRALLAEMDRRAVACAVTFSRRGVEYDCRAGNAETIALARAEPRFIPCATVDLRDAPLWEEELRACRQAGVRLVRLFPGAQNWSPDSQSGRRLFALLRETGQIPLFSATDGPDAGSRPRVLAALTAEAGIPLVLLDVRYGNMAECLALMQAFPHVLAETHGLATVDAVGIMARAVGADRLLFSSAGPEQSLSKALNQVLETDLTAAEKAAILGGNAMRLLDRPPARFAGLPECHTLQPDPLSEPAVDVHSHLGHWRHPCVHEEYDPAPMLARMDRLNIAYGILSSYESMRYDLAAGNRRLADAIRDRPRLRGFIELDPYQPALSRGEIARYSREPAFAGCELELTHIPCPTDSPKVRAVLEAAAAWGKPVLFMPASPQDAAAERALARDFPRLPIIHAHGAEPDWARQVADTPNLHIEFCLSRANVLHLRETLDILGPSRVLFGTDQTLLSPFGQAGLYADALRTDAERRAVLHENARRLFGLPPA